MKRIRISNAGICGECNVYIPSQPHSPECSIGPKPRKCGHCKKVHTARTECFYERQFHERKKRKNPYESKGKQRHHRR